MMAIIKIFVTVIVTCYKQDPIQMLRILGVTPLGIAVIQKNKSLCELVLDYHACAAAP